MHNNTQEIQREGSSYLSFLYEHPFLRQPGPVVLQYRGINQDGMPINDDRQALGTALGLDQKMGDIPARSTR